MDIIIITVFWLLDLLIIWSMCIVSTRTGRCGEEIHHAHNKPQILAVRTNPSTWNETEIPPRPTTIVISTATKIQERIYGKRLYITKIRRFYRLKTFWRARSMKKTADRFSCSTLRADASSLSARYQEARLSDVLARQGVVLTVAQYLSRSIGWSSFILILFLIRLFLCSIFYRRKSFVNSINAISDRNDNDNDWIVHLSSFLDAQVQGKQTH